MGIDLFNDEGDALQFSHAGWALALNLAERFGWVPAGTTLPGHGGDPDDQDDADDERGFVWTGQYDSNDEQIVSAADAAELAAACERALRADDFAQALRALDAQLFPPAADPWPGSPGKPPLPPRQQLGDDEIEMFREELEDFVAFCRQGSFQIG